MKLSLLQQMSYSYYINYCPLAYNNNHNSQLHLLYMQYISTEPNYQSLAIPFSETTRNKGKWCLQLTEWNMDRNGGIERCCCLN